LALLVLFFFIALSETITNEDWFFAVSDGDIQKVRRMLNDGFDVNTSNQFGTVPYLWTDILNI